MPKLNRFATTRIVATPQALDAAAWPAGTITLRSAPDEVWLTPLVEDAAVDDPHAIIIKDSSLAGVWLPAEEALAILERLCEWEIPSARPAFAQGSVAGVATKLWLEEDRILIIVPAPYAAEMEERLA